MDFWKSLEGMVEVELTSAEPAAALAAIIARGISLYDVRWMDDLTCRFHVRRRDDQTLKKLCEKRGETLRICDKSGIFWSFQRMLHRPVLMVGLGAFLLAALYLPSRIFFVRVDGNSSVPTRLILEAAEESGICFGASRRAVRSEKIKNALLSEVPQLQWAGVNTAGCVATISVRERTEPEIVEQKNSVSSIVASRDGFIVSMTATRGNALCQVGQGVKAGQVLISGYTDCGICIQATKAEGEVFAQTSRSLTAQTPSEWSLRAGITEAKRKYSLVIGKKRINLWKDSGNFGGSCGRMDTVYSVTLPGGFALPLRLRMEEYTFFDSKPTELELSGIRSSLSAFADRYLRQQMVAGQILGKLETVSTGNGVYRLEGEYICTEMIGRTRKEQIGDTNGKSG